MSLLPLIQPKAQTVETALPLYREVAWDFKENKPLFRGGNPVIVTGAEVVLVWAWKALQVARYRYPIYSWEYGNEWEELVGAAYTEELKRAEAVRYVGECLLTNPYIRSVGHVTVSFEDGVLSAGCKVETIYGEVDVYV